MTKNTIKDDRKARLTKAWAKVAMALVIGVFFYVSVEILPKFGVVGIGLAVMLQVLLVVMTLVLIIMAGHK